MKPYLHGLVSTKKFGGKPEDYQAIHDFIDSSKAHLADVRHRALLHSSFGIYMCEQVFGTYIVNSDNQIVQVRDIAEYHIIEDLGRIPSVQDWLGNMKIQSWMGGKIRHRKQTVPNRGVENELTEAD
jgi:hypothetical protein